MLKKETSPKVQMTYLVISIIVSVVFGSMLIWYDATFGVSLSEILYTITSPLEGASYGFLLVAAGVLVASSYIAYILIKLAREAIYINQGQVPVGKIWFANRLKKETLHTILIILIVFSSIGSLIVIIRTDQILKISKMIKSSLQKTTIYDDYYVVPVVDDIKAEQERNLIYIYLESMETTYASDKVGGRQGENNYIPHLTKIAKQEISFSNTEKLGGFHCNTGAGWTMGAIFSAESGIPFAFPIDGNHMDRVAEFASGTIALGDILESKGYAQEFLCGSESEFAGRRRFFEQHGNYQIYDLDTAIDNGLMSEEEEVWWGFEDQMLYEIAKDELTRLSEGSQPFNLTMLTVDTHHVDGWVCELCEGKYPDQVANVISCADNQVFDFIEWCKEQDWYDNTTIVIQGDHPRMDQSLVDGIDYYDRTIYNCFINTGFDKDLLNCSNREFTAFDMYPTVLASIGFKVPDDRLGLGVNMFSGKETLAEKLGYDYIESEITKSSDYYKQFY